MKLGINDKLTDVASFKESLTINSSIFLDIRSPREFNRGHATESVNIPLFNNDEFSDIEKPKFYKIIDPDIHIDFSNSDHWEGLDTSSDYWKIKNGEGHFFLHSKQQQLGSATFDLLPLLESDIGEDWILRYKLQIDNYQQTTSSKWSELLIGLSLIHI